MSSKFDLARGMAEGSAALLAAMRAQHAEYGARAAGPPARVGALVLHVARISRVSVADIIGRRRLRPLVDLRRAVALVALELGYSTPQIGRQMERDHSTIGNLRQTGEYRLSRDQALAWLVDRLAIAGECEPWGPGNLREVPLRMAPVQLRADSPIEDVVAAAPAQLAPTGEYAPRHALTLTRLPLPGTPPDGDAAPPEVLYRERSAAAGSRALLCALWREHPERFPQVAA